MLEYVNCPIIKRRLHSECRTGAVSWCSFYARRTHSICPSTIYSKEKNKTVNIAQELDWRNESWISI